MGRLGGFVLRNLWIWGLSEFGLLWIEGRYWRGEEACVFQLRLIFEIPVLTWKIM